MTDKTENKPQTFEQKVSYGFGWQFGRQMQKNRFEGMDIEAAVQALRACFNGEPSALSESELNEAYDTVKEKRIQFEKDRAEKYQELCKTFLDENAKREGVQVTDSGLQYEVLEAGNGEKPTHNDKVKVHYHGSFIDGQVFDSSITRNEPAEFAVEQVIPGWTEALLMMPMGSKWRLVVPPKLAYGEMGSPPTIPANAVLTFDIHLIEIVK
jgi:FKBP-type peptidyl-prolyl cis-trans isomerase FklB